MQDTNDFLNMFGEPVAKLRTYRVEADVQITEAQKETYLPPTSYTDEAWAEVSVTDPDEAVYWFNYMIGLDNDRSLGSRSVEILRYTSIKEMV